MLRHPSVLLFLLLIPCACAAPSFAQRSTGICNYRDGRGWVPCVDGPPVQAAPDPAVLEKNRRIEKAKEVNQEAKNAWDKGDWRTAAEYERQAIELNPDEPVYKQNLAKVQAKIDAEEAERQRREREERERREKFERDKSDMLQNLKTVTSEGVINSGSSELTLKTVTIDDQPKPPDKPEKTLQESQYFYALQTRQLEPLNDGGSPIDSIPDTGGVHGLVGGTSWTYGFKRPKVSCTADCRATMKAALDKQLSLYCSSQADPTQCMSDGLPFTPEDYDFVVSMGSYHSFIEDLALRVVFDSATFGKFTAEHKEIFASLLDRQFDQLDCHSNGAMLCLAALESGRTKATEVRLFGPQINPAAAEKWKALAAKGVKVTIYVNNGDPVPALSWQQPVPQTFVGKLATAMWLSNPREAVPSIARAAVNTYGDSKTQWVDKDLKGYGFSVNRLTCSDHMNSDCHAMKAYETGVKNNLVKK